MHTFLALAGGEVHCLFVCLFVCFLRETEPENYQCQAEADCGLCWE